MAIEIIPKKEKRIKKWEELLSLVCILILIASLISIPVLILVEKKAQERIQNLKEKIELAKSEEIRKMEEEISKYQTKITNFHNLIANHYFPSKIFPVLEENTHPKVFFSKFDFSSKNFKVLLSGTTENFVSLAQQISVLEESKIGKIELTKVSIDEKGKINFDLEISIREEILK